MGIKHHHQTALPNDPSKDVSATSWNEDHDVTSLVVSGELTVNSTVLTGSAIALNATANSTDYRDFVLITVADATLGNGSLFRIMGGFAGGTEMLRLGRSGDFATIGAMKSLVGVAHFAHGDWWYGTYVGNTDSGYLGIFAGLDNPTFSTFGRAGGIYLNGNTPGIPYYNTDGGTGWDRLVGGAADQPITNKQQLHLTPQSAPASPASGWVIYVDTADGTLKAKNASGTVRSLAAP